MELENRLRERYESDKPVYKCWGNYLNKTITEEIKKYLGSKENLDIFLKIIPQPRIKETDSLIAKALRRNKSYKNPYEEITDKVGIRYVTLLTSEIQVVSKIIKKLKSVSVTKDKDYKLEIKEKPLIFDYQSIHYIVRNKRDIILKGVKIPKHTPCEIQLRTLLQHAYAELTHDRIYKARRKTDPKIERYASRSMALIETTDINFELVNKKIEQASKEMNTIIDKLTLLYKRIGIPKIDDKLNLALLEPYEKEFKKIDWKKLYKLSKDNLVRSSIQKRSTDSILFKQPAILFIYYLATFRPNACKSYWPLPEDELQPIYYDLGFSFDSIN